MSRLFAKIRDAVAAGRVAATVHADNRLDERGVAFWQVIAGVRDARLITERITARPNPVVELEQTLSDGTRYKAVWSWLKHSMVARLVTVHFFDL